MKPFKQLCSLVLLLALFLCGCQTQPQTPVSPADPMALYTPACQKLNDATQLTLTYTVESQRSVGDQLYTNRIEGDSAYADLNQSTMTAMIRETLHYGSYTNHYEEIYCNGTAFAVVDDRQFGNEQAPEAFVARQIPAVLLNEKLYQTVTLSAGPENTQIISFSDATGLESWLNLENTAQLTEASGTAVINSAGDLVETTYTAKYLIGSTEYTYSVTGKPVIPKSLDLSGTHPEHFENAAVLSDLRILKLLMQTAGDICTANYISCTSQESVFSDAVPITFVQTGNYTLRGRGDSLTAKMEFSSTTSDYRGAFSTVTQIDSFENNVFSSSVNGKEPVTQPEISAEQMRQSSEDLILFALFTIKHLDSGTLTQTQDGYRLNFTGNEAFVTDTVQEASDFLNANLGKYTQDGTIEDASGYLTLDAETLLPTSMGISIKRVHVYSTIPFELRFQLDHTLSLQPEE